jgi:hypothetical protein
LRAWPAPNSCSGINPFAGAFFHPAIARVCLNRLAAPGSDSCVKRRNYVNLIILIIVLMFLFGGGGYYYGGPYVGGGLGTVLLIVLIVLLIRG